MRFPTLSSCNWGLWNFFLFQARPQVHKEFYFLLSEYLVDLKIFWQVAKKIELYFFYQLFKILKNHRKYVTSYFTKHS